MHDNPAKPPVAPGALMRLVAAGAGLPFLSWPVGVIMQPCTTPLLP